MAQLYECNDCRMKFRLFDDDIGYCPNCGRLNIEKFEDKDHD
jgi:hypothetical protein